MQYLMPPRLDCSHRTAEILSLRSPRMDTFTRAFRRSGDTSTSTMEIISRMAVSRRLPRMSPV
eukprot:scaffold132697_cov48-Phaeocystis_antarctica.AAC.1